MTDRKNARLSTRWWLALALAATGIIAGVTLWLVWDRSPVGGAATPEEAVTAYVDALNRNDAEALRRLSITGGPTLEAGIQRRLAEYGGRSIRLTSQDVNELTPTNASAHLIGTMTAESGPEQAYQDRLGMNRHEDRWYMNLHDRLPGTGTPTGTPPLPTAGVNRPG